MYIILLGDNIIDFMRAIYLSENSTVEKQNINDIFSFIFNKNLNYLVLIFVFHDLKKKKANCTKISSQVLPRGILDYKLINFYTNFMLFYQSNKYS